MATIISGVKLLISDQDGIYVPRTFARNFHLLRSNVDTELGWKGISEWEEQTLLAGPTDSDYWEAWQSVLGHATFIDLAGNEWILFQDGDLFGLCPELMTAEEKYAFGLSG